MKVRPAAEADKLIENYIIGNSAVKSVALTPCGHRSDKKRIYAAKGLRQNSKHCKLLRKLYLQTEKVKTKMLQAINQIPLYACARVLRKVGIFVAGHHLLGENTYHSSIVRKLHETQLRFFSECRLDDAYSMLALALPKLN
jgi:hypothetical protein